MTWGKLFYDKYFNPTIELMLIAGFLVFDVCLADFVFYISNRIPVPNEAFRNTEAKEADNTNDKYVDAVENHF